MDIPLQVRWNTATSTQGYPGAYILTLNAFAELTHHAKEASIHLSPAQANPHWSQGPALKA